MTDFAPWIRPTLLGPFLTMFALATVSHLALGGAADVLFLPGFLAGQHFDSWVIAMLFSSVIASGVVVSLIAADVMLLAVKVRRLPTGFGAWLGAMIAPFALFFAWHLIGGESESVLEAALSIALPFPASALFVRFVIGRKP